MADTNSAESSAARWLRRILPLLVLALGIAVTITLVRSRKAPKRRTRTQQGMLVETMEARGETRRVRVRSHGTVQPRHEVQLASEVSAKVVWVHPQLVVGGMIKRGAPLLRLSAIDFHLTLQQARAQVVQAEKNLAEAESNAAVARREWKVLGKSSGGKPSSLTLFEPQLKLAQAALASAKAMVAQARINVGRTLITAPFNLRVRAKAVDVGQYVRVGQTLATVYGTDEAEVVVPLPVDELRWIDVPRPHAAIATKGSSAPRGSPAWVELRVGQKRYRRRGYVVRSIGEVDPTGRLTKVAVRLEDPYQLRTRPKTKVSAEGATQQPYAPDFEVGSFVAVTIEGRELPGPVIPIPAVALRVGRTVWVATKANRLAVRKVTVIRLTTSEALVSSGLHAGDRVITSPVAGAVDGLRLRVKGGARPDQLRAAKDNRAR